MSIVYPATFNLSEVCQVEQCDSLRVCDLSDGRFEERDISFFNYSQNMIVSYKPFRTIWRILDLLAKLIFRVCTHNDVWYWSLNEK